MNVDLSSCIAGRKDAWDQFVRASAPVIYAAVRKSVRARGLSADDINDRVQDVYVRLLREDCRLLRAYDPSRASLVTWLTLIARTVVHEHVRRKTLATSSIEAAGSGLADHSPTPETAAIDAGLGDIPISILTEQQRHVIEMLFRDGMTVEEAALRLGVEAQTIRSTKHKALTRLRAYFSGHAVHETSSSNPPVRGEARHGKPLEHMEFEDEPTLDQPQPPAR